MEAMPFMAFRRSAMSAAGGAEKFAAAACGSFSLLNTAAVAFKTIHAQASP